MKSLYTPGRLLHSFGPGLAVFALFFAVNLAGYGQIFDTNRIAAWQGNVGVQGGIPNRTNIFVNVLTTSNPAYHCHADGVTDDSAIVSNAIVNCPSNEVVYMPAGTYLFTNSINISSAHNGWTLRGAGSTTVIMAAQQKNQTLIFCGGGDYFPSNPSLSTNLTGGYTKGSTNLSIANASLIFLGELLWIDQLNDGTNVTSYGSGNQGLAYDRPRNGTRNMGQMVQVTGINGNNLTTWPPLVATFTASQVPQASRVRYTIHNVGIEDLKIWDTTGNDQYHIYYNYSENCWIKNVETYLGSHWHIWIDFSLFDEVRDSFVHEATQYTVNSGYGMEFHQCTGFLIENNILWHLYAPMLICAGDSGNVIGYNYIYQTYDTDPTYEITGLSANHGPHAMFNLFEGNCFDRFQTDFYFGSSGCQTLFRNWITGCDPNVTQNRICVMLDGFSRSNNVVGNILGSPTVTNWTYDPYPTNGFGHSVNIIYRLGYPQIGNNNYNNATTTPGTNDVDLRVRQSILIDGNYDFATYSTIWNPAISTTNMPHSMYLTGVPSWWGAGSWPPFGSDLNPPISPTPAIARFNALIAAGTVSAQALAIPEVGTGGTHQGLLPPGNLRVVQ